MTIQERLLISGCVAGLQIAEVAIESPKLRYYHFIPADWFVGLRVVRDPSPHWRFGQRNIGAKGRASRLVLRNWVFNPLLEGNGWDQIRSL
jgi:hypothetical protein